MAKKFNPLRIFLSASTHTTCFEISKGLKENEKRIKLRLVDHIEK